MNHSTTWKFGSRLRTNPERSGLAAQISRNSDFPYHRATQTWRPPIDMSITIPPRSYNLPDSFSSEAENVRNLLQVITAAMHPKDHLVTIDVWPGSALRPFVASHVASMKLAKEGDIALQHTGAVPPI